MSTHTHTRTLILVCRLSEYDFNGGLAPAQGLTRGHRSLPGRIKALRCVERWQSEGIRPVFHLQVLS